MSMARVFCFFGHAALGGCAVSFRTGSMACTPRTGGIALKDCPRWKPSASQPAHFRYWRETDVAVATFDVCFVGAGSTGRRNTGVKSLCWGFKLQGLTWSFIELTSHFVQIGLRVHRQVGETSEEHPMLMHFSMIVLSSQLVVAVADHPPAFDIARGCKVDSASAFDPNAGMNARCMDDEQQAKDICSRHNVGVRELRPRHVHQRSSWQQGRRRSRSAKLRRFVDMHSGRAVGAKASEKLKAACGGKPIDDSSNLER